MGDESRAMQAKSGEGPARGLGESQALEFARTSRGTGEPTGVEGDASAAAASTIGKKANSGADAPTGYDMERLEGPAGSRLADTPDSLRPAMVMGAGAAFPVGRCPGGLKESGVAAEGRRGIAR
jgi:hypothetical protein